MQFDDKFTVQIFRFKHIVTGIEHEPSKEEVLEQTQIKVSLQFRARRPFFLPFYYARRVFFPVTAHLNFPATAVNHSL